MFEKTKFVSVLIFTTKPDDLPVFERESKLVLERMTPLLDGFIEGVVMANEQKTEVLIVSYWESRHAWSAAQWDRDVGRAMGDFVGSAENFDVRTYEPILIVHSA